MQQGGPNIFTIIIIVINIYLVFVQVLGVGGGCKDALLCIHLHATSV